MTKESINNPFLPSHDAKPDLSALAEQGFLSSDDVAKLRKLEEQEDRSSKFEVPSSMSDVSLEEGMSAEERKEAEEALNSKAQLVKWYKERGLDIAAVDSDFVIDDDGYAICAGDLMIDSPDDFKYLHFIKEIQGNLWANNLKTAKGLVFPKLIHGDVWLQGLESIKDLTLFGRIEGFIYFGIQITVEEEEDFMNSYPEQSVAFHKS